MAPDPTIPYYLYNPASRVYLSSGLGKTADLRVEGTPAETPHNETQLVRVLDSSLSLTLTLISPNSVEIYRSGRRNNRSSEPEIFDTSS